MSKVLGRLSYANVMVTICFFLLLGGGAYAVSKLPKNSVTSKQIKNGQVKRADLAKNAVKSSHVADGSLLKRDFASGQLPQGPRGEQGPPGPFPDTLPSGETLRGVFALYGVGHEDGAIEVASGDISFAFPLASAPSVKVVQSGTASAPPECPGTAAAPDAAPGWLCVYESRADNQRPGNEYPEVAAPGSDDSPSASRYGARIRLEGQAAGSGWSFWSEGTWAVTGP